MGSLLTKKEEVKNKIKGLLQSLVFWTAVIAIATVFSAWPAYKIYNLYMAREGEIQNKKFNETKGYYEKGKYKEAIEILEILIETYPKLKEPGEVLELLIDCYIGQGKALINLGMIEEGIQFLLEAEDKFPRKRTKNALKIELRYAMGIYEQKKEYSKAVKFARDLHDLCPSLENKNDLVRLLHDWGLRYLHLRKNYHAALEKFEEAYKINPHIQTVRDNLANTLEMIGDSQSKKESRKQKKLARENYLRSHELKPTASIKEKIAAVSRDLYEIYTRSENYSRAEYHLIESIRFSANVLPTLDPNLRMLMDEAEACLSSCLYKEAGIFFREALARNASIPYLYYRKSSIMLIISRDQGGFLNKAFQVNLNKADLVILKLRLEISFEESVKIIENRPYSGVDELLSKGVLPKGKFDKLKGMVTVR